jgi:hypothetical protein
VIVYLNGGFGVGKTTVAELLVETLQPAMLFDPESVGGILADTLSSIDPKSDFQEYAIWVNLVESFLRQLRAAYTTTTIVVPMSVLNADRRKSFVARLREVDRDAYDFTLVADRNELRRRIMERPLKSSSREWCLEHLGDAPTATSFLRTNAIDTTRLTPQDVAASILAAIETKRL